MNIWIEGAYSEGLHFASAFLLVWVLLRRTLDTDLISLRTDRLSGALVIGVCFGFGGLLHLVLDGLQNIF